MRTTRIFLRLSERSFSFRGINQSATNQNLYDFAQAVNSLQNVELKQVVKIERVTL